MTPTPARTYSPDGGHWYFPDGKPAYEVPYADPSKGMRRTTLADARKLNLLPSVTTILRCLHKQTLVDWLIEQACLAVLTTPRKDGEGLDAFVERVLHTEKVQDQEAEAARDRGTEIHAAMEAVFAGQAVDTIPAPEFLGVWPWIEPAYKEINSRGKTIGTETIVVGPGYAGKIDLVQEGDEIWLYDWKTTKRLPQNEAYWEHKCQLGAYALALSKAGTTGNKRIRTCNVYISTIEQGMFKVCDHSDWKEAGEAFSHLVSYWQIANNYFPTR